ncbi:MAG: flagellar filament capping protein FliD [Ignavibacteriales bacterium]
MASSSLTTSGITSFINSYKLTERNKIVAPLTNKKTSYQNRYSAYSEISSKLSSLKSLMTDFKLTGSDSVFRAKKATSSNSNFVSATVTNSANVSAYQLFVSQLAKSDIAVSKDLTSSSTNTISGTHSFTIKTGDGEGGEFLSKIDVEFTGSETNQTMMEKIANAINADKAEVLSTNKTATSAYSGGTSTFTININGTETDITVNGGGTYEELVDEIINQVNENVTGVTAEKVLDSPNAGDVKLKLTVDDSDDYISITSKSGFDLVSDLGISATKEKGASGIVTASVFSPSTDVSQMSITSKKTGVDYRIKSLADESGSSALTELGLNLGTSRTAYNQSADPDTPGFIYSDITTANNQLNSRITFNGLSIQKNSNSIDDLVSGVTFNLNSVMQSTDSNVNIAVANNVEEVKSQIESFVTKFNDIYKYLKSATSSVDGKRGNLISDANANSLLQFFRSAAYSEVTGLPTNNIKYLTQMGITFDSANGLSISDSSLLEKKITDNADQVEAVFNSTNGLANLIYDKIDPYLGSGGYLALSQSSIDSSISYLSDKIANAESRIDKSAEVLRNKYQALQNQLSILLTTSSLFTNTNSTDSYF